ncbi:MAG TPA: TetR family transcriptional regulator [Solirubrobacteraceae bacterium]|nr:TetR family transcriptional regulator [Solirubrobacteraceae bacterium]
MSSLDTSATKLGLRERKKQQTRDTIARAALRLFAERGYDETTLADIAEAANVAPRTIFAYFEGKEDILLCEENGFLTQLKQRLDNRPEGTTTVDAIRGFLSSIEHPDEEAKLRKQVISANPELRVKMRGRHAELEPMLAESIAKDLGAEPGDIRPLLIAASMATAFTSVSDRIFAAEAAGEPLAPEQAMAIIDQVLEFLRGGLEALQREG